MENCIAGRSGLFSNGSRLDFLLDDLKHYRPMSEKIEEFWLDEENRETKSWLDHADINMVMLATSLAPAGFLEI